MLRRLAAATAFSCRLTQGQLGILATLIFIAFPHLQSQTQYFPPTPTEAVCNTEVSRTAVTACTLNVQAGIPYSGKVGEYRSCPGQRNLHFSVIWDSTRKSFDLQDSDRNGVLSGTHTWTTPGEYQLRVESRYATANSGRALQRRVDSSTNCAARGSSASAPVHVFAPAPPISMFISARKLHSGHTYTDAGAVALRGPAPPSGMLLMLETNQPGKVDVQTSFGRTGPGKRRTYLWIKPGSNTRSFDVIVASGVRAEFEAEIRSDCAGAVVPKSECDPTSGIKPSKVFPIEIH